MRLTNPEKTFEYVHPSERDLPREQQTIFLHGAMSWRDKCGWFEEEMDARKQSGADNPEDIERRINSHQAYELTAKYLVEVQNYEGDDGERRTEVLPTKGANVREDRDRFVSRLPIDVAFGVCSSVVKASFIDQADVGKS